MGIGLNKPCPELVSRGIAVASHRCPWCGRSLDVVWMDGQLYIEGAPVDPGELVNCDCGETFQVTSMAWRVVVRLTRWSEDEGPPQPRANGQPPGG